MYKLLFILLSCINFSLNANNDSEGTSAGVSIEILNGEPSVFVNDSVNAISGAYNEAEADVIIPGPEQLSYQRFMLALIMVWAGLAKDGILIILGKQDYLMMMEKERHLELFFGIMEEAMRFMKGNIQNPDQNPMCMQSVQIRLVKA